MRQFGVISSSQLVLLTVYFEVARVEGKILQHTPTNRTAGELAAIGSSASPALSLAADLGVIIVQTNKTVAAKHRCWDAKGNRVRNDSVNAETPLNMTHKLTQKSDYA